MEQVQYSGSAEVCNPQLSSQPSSRVIEARRFGFDAENRITFGRWAVIPGARVLLRDEKPVVLGSRAFDLLVVLLSARGAVVSKRDIMRHVWPSTVVEDSNLRLQITMLRRALGKQRDVIKTIIGRGYLLAVEPGIWQIRPRSGGLAETPVEQLELLSSGAVTDVQRSFDPAPDLDVKRLTVAIVDDDGHTREALHALVRSIGLQAESFASVSAFLDRARSLHPECLILDAWLPDRTGLELQAELREAGLKIPVIFISGHADVYTCVRAMKGGALDFFTKPVRHQELIEAIRQAIAPKLDCHETPGAVRNVMQP